MKDINFFEPYISRRKSEINPYLLINLLFSFIMIILIMYITFNKLRLNKINADIYNMELEIKNSNVLKKVEEIEQKERELVLYREELDKLTDFQNTIEDKYFIDIDLISSIVSRMPNGVFLESIEFHQGEIYLQGIAKEQISIVEFIRGLENIEEIRTALISNITSIKEQYRFNINIVSKEVLTIEED